MLTVYKRQLLIKTQFQFPLSTLFMHVWLYFHYSVIVVFVYFSVYCLPISLALRISHPIVQLRNWFEFLMNFLDGLIT